MVQDSVLIVRKGAHFASRLSGPDAISLLLSIDGLSLVPLTLTRFNTAKRSR